MGALAYLISIITAFEISFAFYFIGIKLSINNNNLICALIFLLVIAICYLVEKFRYKYYAFKFKNIIREKSIKKIKNVINKTSDIVLKVKLSIIMSDYFCFKDDYSSALKILECSMHFMNKSNRVFGLSKKFKVQYYSKCIYLYVVSNNLIMAQESLEKGKMLFKSKNLNFKEQFEIIRGISMLEYSKGNYITSQKLAIQGIKQSNSQKQKEEFELLNAKCLLKLGFEEDADKKLSYLMKKSSNSYVSRCAREIILQKNR